MPVFDLELKIYEFFSQGSKWPPLQLFMEAMSDFSLALYLSPVLMFVLGRKFGAKKAAMILLLIIVGVAISDLISYRIIKAFFERPRPHFYNLGPCEKSKCWGFVSSHAANIACFAMLIKEYLPRAKVLWTMLAFFVCFSRVYLEDHFLFDIIGGSLLGYLVAKFLIYIMKRRTLNKMTPL